MGFDFVKRGLTFDNFGVLTSQNPILTVQNMILTGQNINLAIFFNIITTLEILKIFNYIIRNFT